MRQQEVGHGEVLCCNEGAVLQPALQIAQHPMAPTSEELAVLVATHHPIPPAPKGGNARAVQGPIEQLVAEAKAAAGDKDVYLDGGDLVRQGLDAGLVDELCLTVLPLVLGRGIRLWDGLQNRNDLEFDPPVIHEGRMVQLTARVMSRP